MPVFELPTSHTQSASLFGLWRGAPETVLSPETISFGLGEEKDRSSPPDVTVWRIHLSSEPRHAFERLSSVQAHISASQRALPAVEQRLNALAHRSAAAAHDHLSFNLPSAISEDPADQELLHLLADIEQHERRGDGHRPPKTAGGRQSLSFGVRDGAEAVWGQVQEHIESFIERLRAFASYVQVETVVDDLLLGKTHMGWGGDIRTIWHARVNAQQSTMHLRSLTVALQSQDTFLRTLTIAAEGAVKLSVLLSAPGGVVLALPVAWNYINRLLQQQQIRESLQNSNSQTVL